MFWPNNANSRYTAVVELGMKSMLIIFSTSLACDSVRGERWTLEYLPEWVGSAYVCRVVRYLRMGIASSSPSPLSSLFAYARCIEDGSRKFLCLGEAHRT